MPAKKNKISFEDALKELEAITLSLEAGSLSLENSIKAFSRGSELKKICQDRLNEAESKIQILEKSDSKTKVHNIELDENGDFPEKNDIQGILL